MLYRNRDRKSTKETHRSSRQIVGPSLDIGNVLNY